ncbi:unnamed protein product [Toxocara canis]|uniref:DUF5641 domain-containing protein n=1 Tax=Toxocara canis TaxID=6265 RepID=A0A183VF76_TOXCA|nr:unnamed protein product [Toxocara canis]
MVWNEEKKKLRIVCDASASAQKARSLNDNLFRGPVMLPGLTGVLLGLRQPPIALIRDLEKAFLQAQFNEINRNGTRFLWLEDPASIPESDRHSNPRAKVLGVLWEAEVDTSSVKTQPPVTEAFLQKTQGRTPEGITKVTILGRYGGREHLLVVKVLLRQAQTGAISLKDIDGWDRQQDTKGLWRCTGTLAYSCLSRETKHPIFLPRHHAITKLLVIHCHNILLHSGVSTTLTYLRQRYWLQHGRQKVKRTIRERCMECRKWSAKPFQLPPLPPLPSSRMQTSPAFKFTAMDCSGSIKVKGPSDIGKQWVAPLTCLCTRAVHLEIIDSLPADGFQHCLRRFMARRGVPKNILSGNGTNFKLAAASMKFIPAASEIKWSFVTAFAPWKGVGKVVLLSTPSTPHGNWKLVRIIQTPHTSDGTVRTATVRAASGHNLATNIKLMFTGSYRGT